MAQMVWDAGFTSFGTSERRHMDGSARPAFLVRDCVGDFGPGHTVPVSAGGIVGCGRSAIPLVGPSGFRRPSSAPRISGLAVAFVSFGGCRWVRAVTRLRSSGGHVHSSGKGFSAQSLHAETTSPRPLPRTPHPRIVFYARRSAAIHRRSQRPALISPSCGRNAGAFPA